MSLATLQKLQLKKLTVGRVLAAIGIGAAAAVAVPHVTTPVTYTLVVHVCNGDCALDNKLPKVTVTLDGTTRTAVTGNSGDAGFDGLAAGHYTVCAAADGFAAGCGDATVPPGNADVFVSLMPTHVDPRGIPLGELARIRGAMWSVRLNLPFGPRPGQDDNIAATDFFEDYSPDDQARVITAIKARGYTHVVVGPLVDSDGYHGQFAPHDWRGAEFDRFLDELQTFWDAGLTPIVFIHPDGWTFEQTRDTFTPLLQSERAQRLIRIVVPTGWEPTRYDWSSVTWALYCQWARETLPNALVLIHTVSDVDAPVGTDGRYNDNGKPNAEGWRRVAPWIHGWLVQNGPYETAPSANPALATNFCAQFKVDGDGAAQHSIAWHFKGPGGWTRDSAWGPGIPILLYAAEHTAYESYWKNLPEAATRAWGDLAISCGSDGYLDGGTVDVPRRR